MADPSSSNLLVTGDLSTAQGTMNAKAQQLEAQLDNLERMLAPLIETWQAQSAVFYQEQMGLWHEGAVGLFGQNGVLGTIAHAVGTNYQNYVDTEEANRRMLAR